MSTVAPQPEMPLVRRMPRPTQEQRILARLQQSPGEWVSMPELAKAASPTGNGAGLAVHSRISELRAAGVPIEHVRRMPGASRDQVRSWYRIMEGRVGE